MKMMIPDKDLYKKFLLSIKQKISSAQAKAALTVNASLIKLYWDMGKMIAENQSLLQGRNNYVAQLIKDIQDEFPGITGFSRANIFSIRKFYIYYQEFIIQQPVGPGNNENQNSSVQQLVGLKNKDLLQILMQVPWGHHVLVINKISNACEAVYYLKQTIENNWSRAILSLQIEQKLFHRQGKSITNFQNTLPKKQALLAQQMLKDPYNFGFLTLEPSVQELELERELTNHITKFLLELGKGFAFIGRQYQLEVGEKDYRIDLLFYHIRLSCFIVIDLKTGEFEPEFAGKMNFYLSAVDDLLKTSDDQPSIGIILCKSKSKIEVEYALRDMKKPIGVSNFILTQALPAELKNTIPTVEEFENELNLDLE